MIPPLNWSDLKHVLWHQGESEHAKKRHTPEEMVAKLRQVDVLVSQGSPATDAIRQIGVTEVTYYRWRQEYDGLKLDQVKRLKELELENARLRKAVSDLTPDKLILKEAARATPEPRAAPGVHRARPAGALSISERRACAALGQHPSTQRKIPRGREDEEPLTDDLVALVREHGRLGYRKLAVLLRSTSGWVVNDKRVERIWRQEGLKVPPRQPKRSRIWLSNGACTRLRAERPTHVWSYDFVEDRPHDRLKYRMLNVVDEFMRERLSIKINRKLKSSDVIDILSDLFILRGVPEHIRSDNVLRAEFEMESSHDVSSCKIAPAALSRSIGIRNTTQSRRLPRVMEKVSSIANTGSRNVLALTVLNTSF